MTAGETPMKLLDPIESVLRTKSGDIWSIEPDATVFTAIQSMASRGIGALLVMTGSRLEGIVSERDYARKVILMDRSSKETRVREIMTAPPITVTINDTVEDCMSVMTRHRIRHLPVVDGARVAGVISIGDLVKWAITAHEETIGQLHAYISGNYPG